jgi:hypothetical protein
MKKIHASRWLAVVAALLLAACAAPPKTASGRSEVTEKKVTSSECRGKIAVRGNDGALKKMSAFFDDPVSFHCNAAYQMLFVIRDQAKALDRADQELAATRAIEGLENGTVGPKSVNMVVNYKLSDEQKSSELKMFQDTTFADRKALIEAADKRMNYVYRDLALGVASLGLQYKKAQMALAATNKGKGKGKGASPLENILAGAMVVKAGMDTAKVLSMAPALSQAFSQWQANKAHLAAVLKPDEIDPKALAVQPD